MDIVFIALLWRSLTSGCVGPNACETGFRAWAGIGRSVTSYNRTRPHSALVGRAPEEVHTVCEGIDLVA